MNQEYVFYANDGTRFSSITERDYYNKQLEKEKEKEQEEQPEVLDSQSLRNVFNSNNSLLP